ncbi:pseudouridine synthase [Acidithiobacillus ferriphilus]|uniref:pseudouridine synthase n=1 Tax=Acidithiobacillus ferriphilus TaxID=1689834 RepID=UPI001C065A4E|nr:pseudouridine synthase [Acidithiobacillus ferriphilus]MBU2833094.1 rRNA pseudouridine synthase [Acidithiobacillus ferriphilus]
MKCPSNHSPKPGQNQSAPGFGLARILSKTGLCSRTVAAEWIRAGRVEVDGRRVHDPEARFALSGPKICVDGIEVTASTRRVLLLHKPRGVLSTRRDEKGRATVYDLLPKSPWLAPVGRLDQASSGLLLFSNDPHWAQQLLDPDQHVAKTYHVQIRPPLSASAAAQLATNPTLDGKPCLPLRIRELRCGGKTQWLEFILQEGRNRQIRRLLAASDTEVLRLLRVAVGNLPLGALRPGEWRWLRSDEEDLLRQAPFAHDIARFPPK